METHFLQSWQTQSQGLGLCHAMPCGSGEEIPETSSMQAEASQLNADAYLF